MLALFAQNTTTTTTTPNVDVPAGFVVIQGLMGLLFLAALIFTIIVIIKLFQTGQTGLGIVTIITTFCCGGLGILIAFIVGWMNANTWGIRNMMLAWTAVFVLYILVIIGGFVAFGAAMQDMINQIQKLQKTGGA